MIIDTNTVLECGCTCPNFRCFRKVTYEELEDIVSVNTETGEAIAEDTEHVKRLSYSFRRYNEKDIIVHCKHGLVK